MAKNYEETRFELFIKSYVGQKVIADLRKKYRVITGTTPEIWFNRIVPGGTKAIDFYVERRLEMGDKPLFVKPLRYKLFFEEKEREATPEITKLSKALGFNEEVLRNYIIFNSIYPKIPGKEIIYSPTKIRPISEDGYYIKVEEDTKAKEIKKAAEVIKERLKHQKKLRKIMEIEEPKPLIRNRRTQIPRGDVLKTIIFLKIEKEMLCLSNEKKHKDYDNTGTQRYVGELVGAAIERVVGNLLKRIDDERVFDERFKQKTKQFGTWYYLISSRYKLPTPKKLSSILGLIKS